MNLYANKCINCGANISHSNVNGTVTCEYCGTVYNTGENSDDNINVEQKDNLISYENNDMDNFSTALLSVCIDYAPKNNISSICGTSLEKLDQKFYPKAALLFSIPSAEHIYYIQDCSVLGGCRKGFAIGYNGIYYRTEQKITGFLSWNNFKNSTVKLTSIGQLFIDKLEFNAGGMRTCVTLLEQIQTIVRKFR